MSAQNGPLVPDDASLFDELEEQGLTVEPQVIQEAKPGYKTTEFWLLLIGTLATQVGALDLPGENGKTITTTALFVAYVLSRGIAKAGVPSVPAT